MVGHAALAYGKKVGKIKKRVIKKLLQKKVGASLERVTDRADAPQKD